MTKSRKSKVGKSMRSPRARLPWPHPVRGHCRYPDRPAQFFREYATRRPRSPRALMLGPGAQVGAFAEKRPLSAYLGLTALAAPRSASDGEESAPRAPRGRQRARGRRPELRMRTAGPGAVETAGAEPCPAAGDQRSPFGSDGERISASPARVPSSPRRCCAERCPLSPRSSPRPRPPAVERDDASSGALSPTTCPELQVFCRARSRRGRPRDTVPATTTHRPPARPPMR